MGDRIVAEAPDFFPQGVRIADDFETGTPVDQSDAQMDTDTIIREADQRVTEAQIRGFLEKAFKDLSQKEQFEALLHAGINPLADVDYGRFADPAHAEEIIEALQTQEEEPPVQQMSPAVRAIVRRSGISPPGEADAYSPDGSDL